MRALVTGVVAAALSAVVVTATQDQAAPLKAFETTEASRVGILVNDAAKTAAAFEEIFGIAASPVDSVIPSVFPADYTGDRAAYLGVASIRFDNVTLDIAQPMGGASPWREHLAKYGEGLHHLTFYVGDVDAHVRRLESKGGKLIVGGAEDRRAVVDMMAQFDINIELVEGSPERVSAMLPDVGWNTDWSPEPPAGGLKTLSRIGLLVANTDAVGAAFADIIGVPVKAPINEEGFFPDAPETGIRDSFVPFKTLWVNAIQPLGGKSVWRDMVGRHAGYLNFFVDDVDAVVDMLVKKGGKRTLGATGMPFAYVNMEPQLGVTILLLKSGIMAQ